ncbi:PH domain-containing protein [Nonomuraea sp. NPDC049152]|uniref:PH domain-containing protein n=1 Tax=Nonomuraea sp. NPDC049152 TaxID=3154350 RepID=UPI0033C81524
MSDWEADRAEGRDVSHAGRDDVGRPNGGRSGRGGEGWERLDGRTVGTGLSYVIGPAIPAVAVVAIAGPSSRTVIPLLALLAVLIGVGVLVSLRYATTRYRITDDRVESRSGLLFRRHRSIPRDRVRAVDLTAGPAHRLLGLAVVRIDAGEQQAGLRLDAIARVRAERLRLLLLDKGNAAPAESTLAALRPGWIWFALLSSWTPLIGFAPFGAFFRVLEIFGVEPAEVGFLREAWGEVSVASPVLVAVLAILTVTVIGLVGALALYVEVWWRFSLSREPGGTYRVRRGLISTRSLSLEESRLRGVEMAEPVPLRWGGGARLRALVAGVDPDDDEERTSAALLPPAPRVTALRVAAQVLGGPALTASLRPHPRAALRLRLFRAVWPLALVAPLLAWLGLWLSWVPDWVWVIAPASVLVTLPLAVDAYRNLGHGLAGPYLVTRHGAARRRTVALRRDGIIGWVIGRSPAQRRRGLMTLTAATAAGAHRVRDVGVGDGVGFAEQAVPGLLAPFLGSASPSTPVRS